MAGTRRKQAASGKASTAGRFKKLKKLNKEALKLVDQNAAEIAKLLCGSTLGGDVTSARLLLELAEGNVDAEEPTTMKPLRSQALSLAAEPEWPHDSTETDSGSLEPEC
jgi:hypothetical protein